MTVALITVTILFAGAATTAITLAVKHGNVKAKLAAVSAESDTLQTALLGTSDDLTDTNRRFELFKQDRDREIGDLYEELGQCGTDADRGALAVRGIRRMLSPGDFDNDPTQPE